MKTALVTGVAGFLGRYVAEHFADAGWRVLGVDDIEPSELGLEGKVTLHRMRLPNSALIPVLESTPPDVCVHCAGRASVGHSMDDPTTDFHGNTVLTFELLEALRRHAPCCRFFFLSSAAVYGNPVSLPVSETHTAAPLSPYGFHKWQCELLCLEYAKVFGLATAGVRIFSAYGPGLKRQVLWDICRRALETGELTLQGTGQESRDFIHAEDIARALLVLAERAPAQGEVYNLASGSEVTVAELATTLLRELGLGFDPKFSGTSRAGDPLNWRADIERIQTLGFAPQVSLAEGLRGVAQWARAEIVNS